MVIVPLKSPQQLHYLDRDGKKDNPVPFGREPDEGARTDWFPFFYKTVLQDIVGHTPAKDSGDLKSFAVGLDILRKLKDADDELELENAEYDFVVERIKAARFLTITEQSYEFQQDVLKAKERQQQREKVQREVEKTAAAAEEKVQMSAKEAA